MQSFCRENNWKYCFIGGLALERWGEPRVTVDVDVTLFTGFGNEESYIKALLRQFPARIQDAAQFALENRVLLLKSTSGIGIDIALGGLPFEEAVVSRATEFEYLPKLSLLTCSAEDLIIFKAFANRARDWADIEGIITRQGKGIDWNYIDLHLRPLVELKEEPQILERLQKLRRCSPWCSVSHPYKIHRTQASGLNGRYTLLSIALEGEIPTLRQWLGLLSPAAETPINGRESLVLRVFPGSWNLSSALHLSTMISGSRSECYAEA